MNRRTLVVVGAIIAVVVGYLGYGAYKSREAQQTAMSGITDASARLREALTLEAGPAAPNRAQMVGKLDEHAATVDRAVQALKRVDASRHQALVDAADDYLITAREILKRQADTHRHRLAWNESWGALRQHIRNDNRTGAWVKQAVKVKERANQDFRNYLLAAEAFGKLVESLPASQKKIEPYVGGGAAIGDDILVKARGRVLNDAKRTAAQIDWRG
jgi:hypothetical protein